MKFYQYHTCNNIESAWWGSAIDGIVGKLEIGLWSAYYAGMVVFLAQLLAIFDINQVRTI